MHACMHACIHTYIPTYLHTYIPTYLHTYIPTYLHTYIPTYLHTYIPTYLRMYVRTYIHTYRQTDIHTYISTYYFILYTIHTRFIMFGPSHHFKLRGTFRSSFSPASQGRFPGGGRTAGGWAFLQSDVGEISCWKPFSREHMGKTWENESRCSRNWWRIIGLLKKNKCLTRFQDFHSHVSRQKRTLITCSPSG